MNAAQRPLELILARNLLSSLSTASFLVDEQGMVAFYNEAAGELLGRRFEERGPMSAQEWGQTHGPFDQSGTAIPFGELDLTEGLMHGRPGHSCFRIRSLDGSERMIEAAAMPIVATGGQRGAMVFMWAARAEAEAR
jgi:PAS domain-containing protein